MKLYYSLKSIQKCGAVGREPACELIWGAILARESDAPASCYANLVCY